VGEQKKDGVVRTSFLRLCQQMQEKKERGEEEGGWQRRTLPPRHQGSTIRARELNCRVRYGAGWTLTALATNTRLLVFTLVLHVLLVTYDCQSTHFSITHQKALDH
jgi:hypothetical protein